MNKKAILLLFPFFATTLIEAAAQSTAQFLKISGSSRQDALAGAYTSFREGPDSIGVNPAGIYRPSGINSFLSFNMMPGGLNYFKGFIGTASKYGNFGLQLTNLDSGALQETIVSGRGDVTSTGRIFGVSSQAIGLTYANIFFWKMPIGITAKWIREDYATDIFNTAAADIGIQRYFLKHETLQVGISGLNLGPGYQRRDGSGRTELLPMTARFGIGYKVFDRKYYRAMLVTDASYLTDDGFTNGIGTEHLFMSMVTLRAGYKPVAIRRVFTFGAGFQLKTTSVKYGFDYAFENNADLGSTNRFSLLVVAELNPISSASEPAKPISGAGSFAQCPDLANFHKDNEVHTRLRDKTEFKGKLVFISCMEILLEVPGKGKILIPVEKVEMLDREGYTLIR